MSLHRVATLVFAAIALVSCADSRTTAGSSETHFLLRCSDDSCGPGLQCLCGACSKPCSADAACKPLADDARCAATSASSCATTKSCDVECSSASDCAALSSAHRCEQGRCRAPAASASTDAGSSDPLEPPLMSDPGLTYGPCEDNPLCGGGSPLVQQSSSGECLCVNYCETDDECPQPATGTVRPKCVHDDVVVNGMSGECELPCDSRARCPDGASCTGAVCRFKLGSTVTPVEPTPTPTPTPSQMAGCAPADISALLSQRTALLDCGSLPNEPTGAALEAAAQCVRDALDSGEPFQLQWEITGPDSTRTQGFVGVLDGGEPAVFGFLHDSFGFSLDGPVATWSPCSVFRVLDSCSGSDARSCFECPPRLAEQCNCTHSREPGAVPNVECRDGSAPLDAPPCEPGSCLFDGVCYPSGSRSEDGCCLCENGTGSCIEPAWCPGWVTIGKRCTSSADCGPMSGLHCRTDFFGERGVCTRDCNYGCPTGTECLAAVPDYNGGVVEDMCMRFCATPDACAQEVRGQPLASECDRPADLTRSYCF